MSDPSDCAAQIVAEILQDLTSRRGLRQAWDDIDEDLQVEIKQRWRELVLNHLKLCAVSPER